MSRVIALVLLAGSTACVRLLDTPEKWSCESDSDCWILMVKLPHAESVSRMKNSGSATYFFIKEKLPNNSQNGQTKTGCESFFSHPVYIKGLSPG